jgi:putative tryptophan/tyrosine transport system substrate-binding protein
LPRVEALRQRLRQLGYVEGKNILIEYRYAEGKGERLPDLVAELVRLKVDIIVTIGPGPTLAAKKASGTIPIVFASANDPVGTGLFPAWHDQAGISPVLVSWCQI